MKFSSPMLATMTLITLFTAAPAFALDLQTARKDGQVGENINGYVESLKPSDSGVFELVSEVNAKRKAEYARIAREKGQTVDVVSKLAAQEIISGLEHGASYKDMNGAWKKR